MSDGKPRRKILKTTIYNIRSRCWKDLNVISNEFVVFRYGHSILPIYNEENISEKVLILGGIDLSKPSGSVNEKFSIITLDFAAPLKYKDHQG